MQARLRRIDGGGPGKLTVSEKLKTRPVILEVRGTVRFAQHVLPPGRYRGTQKTGGVRTGGGTAWSAPTYVLKLTPQELDALGWGLSKKLSYVAQDVTAEVKAGLIIVQVS